MIPENIEKVKSDYTDKYVVVDAGRPELARFRDLVGHVKTVNMSGRALVEFMEYHLNIGWFDIDLDYLKVVDKPAPKDPKATAKKAPAKPAAKKTAQADGGKKLSPLELARMQDASGKAKAEKPAAGGKMSTSDVLAAARGAASAKQPAEAKSAPSKEVKPAAPKGKMSTSDILAAARGGASPAKPKEAAPAKEAAAAPAPASSPSASSPPAQVDRSKMSVADMLAMARAQTSGGGAAAAEPAATPEPTAEPQADEPAAGEVVKVDRSSMSVDEMIAYCREKDAQ